MQVHHERVEAVGRFCAGPDHGGEAVDETGRNPVRLERRQIGNQPQFAGGELRGLREIRLLQRRAHGRGVGENALTDPAGAGDVEFTVGVAATAAYAVGERNLDRARLLLEDEGLQRFLRMIGMPLRRLKDGEVQLQTPVRPQNILDEMRQQEILLA